MTAAEILADRARELGEWVNGRPENVDPALPELAAILDESDDVEVLVEAVTALGHAWDARAVEMVLDKVDVDHPDADVRLALARALPNGIHPHSACWERAVDALVALSADDDADVRDWACFALGQTKASSTRVRDALAQRLTDRDDTARCEALRALAATGDARALHALTERLSPQGSGVIWELELEAAAALADPVLYPLLLQLEDEWRGDEDDLVSVLSFAIRRCHPEAPTQAAEVERAYVARVNDLLSADGLTATLSGTYPRTKLQVSGPGSDDPHAYCLHGCDDIWDADEDPTDYPTEQHALSTALTLRARRPDISWGSERRSARRSHRW